MKLSAVRTLLLIAAGFFTAEHVNISFWLVLTLIVLGLILIRSTRGISVYLVLLCTAYLYRHSAQPPAVPPMIYQLRQFQGVVIQEPLAHPEITLKLLSPLSGKVVLRLQDSISGQRYGDLLSISSQIRPLDYPRNPGLPDYNRQLLNQGIIGRASARRSQIRLIRRHLGNPVLNGIIIPARRYLVRVFHRYLPQCDIKLLLGLLVGEKGELSPELSSALADTGLWHLLAVSGLHIGVVVTAIYLLLSVLGIRGWLRFAILTLLTLIYTGIAGWQPSAVRAAIMSWALFLSIPLQRRLTSLTSLAVAGILILILNPDTLSSVGTQLSFTAAAAIITITPKIQDRLRQIPTPARIRKSILLPLAVSIAATAGTLPLLARYFYRFQPLSFLATLLILPLITMIIPLALLVSFSSLLSPVIAGTLAQTLHLLLLLTRTLITVLGKLLCPTVVFTGRIPAPAVWYYYGLLLLILNWHHNRARTLFRIAGLLGLVLLVTGYAIHKPRTAITFLDTGAGDAVLLEDTLGRKLLIDAGIDRTDVLSDYLLSRNIRHLDAAIVTHPDRDHYGGLLRLDPAISIGHLFIPVLSGDTGYQRLLQYLQARGTVIKTAGAGAELQGFGFQIHFLAPDRLTCWLYSRKLAATNQVSIVNLISYSGTNLLFTGDCESASLLKQTAGSARIHILKSPHHGSRRGNPPELFASLQPDYVIVMGRYPTPARIESILPAKRITYLNTRRDGGIILRFPGGKPQFRRN